MPKTKEIPQEPTQEEYSIYVKVRRFLSWKGNKIKAETMTDEKRKKLGENLAKARAALQRKRSIDKSKTQG